MTRATCGLIALVACGASTQPAPIAANAVAGSIASCALTTPRRTKVKLRLHAWLGMVGDRSWLMVERGEDRLELVTLGGDGRLAETVLPIKRPANVWLHVDGSHLWLETGSGPYTYYDVDLASATPTVRVDPTVEARALNGASSFTIDATRVLFYSFGAGPPGPGFELWDREHGKTLALVPQTLIGLDEPEKRCVRDHCFAVPVLGDGPERRLTAFRFAPDGALSKLQLADDHLDKVVLVPDGDRTHVVWTSFSRPGLFERTLDDTGDPIDSEVMLSPVASGPELVTGDPLQLAFTGEGRHWHVATLAPDGRSFAHDTALPLGGYFVTAAPTRDGLLALGFDSDASPDMAVPPTKAAAVFVPAGGDPDRPIDGRNSLPAGSAAAGQRGVIDVMFGEKHASWVPFPLVSPGYAAVLLVKVGYADTAGELVMLREPCAR